jgi:hypothetical protein
MQSVERTSILYFMFISPSCLFVMKVGGLQSSYIYIQYSDTWARNVENDLGYLQCDWRFERIWCSSFEGLRQIQAN